MVVDGSGVDASSTLSGGIFAPAISSLGQAIIKVTSNLEPDSVTLNKISLEVTGVQKVKVTVYNGDGYMTYLQFVSFECLDCTRIYIFKVYSSEVFSVIFHL